MILCAIGSMQRTDGPGLLWIEILMSFMFYIPVVFLAKKHPKIGMLMLPKSCAYVISVLMGSSFSNI